MTHEEKKEHIRSKCDAAECNEQARRRHFQQFVYERWDCHPPADFKAWVEQCHYDGESAIIDRQLEEGKTPMSRTKAPNPITAWNSDVARQEFYKWRGEQNLFQLKEKDPF